MTDKWERKVHESQAARRAEVAAQMQEARERAQRDRDAAMARVEAAADNAQRELKEALDRVDRGQSVDPTKNILPALSGTLAATGKFLMELDVALARAVKRADQNKSVKIFLPRESIEEWRAQIGRLVYPAVTFTNGSPIDGKTFGDDFEEMTGFALPGTLKPDKEVTDDRRTQ